MHSTKEVQAANTEQKVCGGKTKRTGTDQSSVLTVVVVVTSSVTTFRVSTTEM